MQERANGGGSHIGVPASVSAFATFRRTFRCIGGAMHVRR
ncbi:hypothetical protein BDSB_17885 [Burkholderia dolosa PC543]|nr:hypothetical protein BDSB_17885 [Burkholderia dolosa PC543]